MSAAPHAHVRPAHGRHRPPGLVPCRPGYREAPAPGNDGSPGAGARFASQRVRPRGRRGVPTSAGRALPRQPRWPEARLPAPLGLTPGRPNARPGWRRGLCPDPCQVAGAALHGARRCRPWTAKREPRCARCPASRRSLRPPLSRDEHLAVEAPGVRSVEVLQRPRFPAVTDDCGDHPASLRVSEPDRRRPMQSPLDGPARARRSQLFCCGRRLFVPLHFSFWPLCPSVCQGRTPLRAPTRPGRGAINGR